MISQFQIASVLIAALAGLLLHWGEPLSLIVLILVLGLAPLAESLLKPSLDALSPGVLLPPIYCFYALGPLVGFESDPHITESYLVLQFLGMVSMRVGVHAGEIGWIPTRQADPADWEADLLWLKKMLIAFGVLSITSAYSEINAFGGLAQYIKLGYGAARFAVLDENAHFGGGVVWLILSFELAAYYYFKTNRKKLAWLCIAGYSLFVFLELRVGARGTIVLTVLAGVYAYHYEYRRISGKWIVPGLAAAACVSQFFSVARAFLQQGVGGSVVQGFDVVRRAPELLVPWAGGEAQMPGHSLLEILVNGGPHRQWGATYLGALLGLIPFFGHVAETAFMNPVIWRLQTFAPDLLAIHGGLGFSPVTEAYMNFGAPGVCLMLGLYGFATGLIARRYRERASCAALMLLALSLPLFYLDGIRIDAASFLFKWIRLYLAPLIIFLLLRGRTKPDSSGDRERYGIDLRAAQH